MKRLTVLSFLSIVLVFTALVSGAVQAQESEDFTLPPEYVAQRPLSNAGMQIQDIIRDNDLSGLLGIKLDNENSAVLVYWHGEKVPSQISNFVAASDVTITIVSVPYSMNELMAEIDRISGMRQHGKITLNSIGVNDTFDGIRIGFSTPGEGTEVEKVQAAIAEISSTMPLTFEVETPLTPFRDRWDDQDPFYGGAAMDKQVSRIPPGYNYCSSGFAVTLSDGSEGMLTAAHCEFEDGVEWQTPDGDLVIGRHGNTTSCSTGGAVLNPTDDGQTYDGRVYRGSWQSGSSANVLSHITAMVNDRVFVSGGLSGEHLVRVYRINDYVWVGSFCGTRVGPGFHTIDDQSDGSVGEGDSGGPVYQYLGARDVRPAGIIQAGDALNHSAPCEGYQGNGWKGDRKCAYQSFHSNIGAILNALDLDLQ